MIFAKWLAAALVCAAACAAGNAPATQWSCTNESDSGTRNSWTLTIRNDGSKLIGNLTDGEAVIELSDIKREQTTLTFRFFVNGKPYGFEGKSEGATLTGKYAGEEARGTLRCRQSGD